MIATIKKPLYKHHALNRTMASGFNQLNAFAITIIPFLLLKNELSIGLLTSLSGLVAAAVALGARRIRHDRQLRIGYGAYGLRGIAGLLFVSGWTAPLMVAWQTVGKLVTPLHDPLQQSLDIHTDSLILGKDAKRHALSINILNNTLTLVGTTLAYGGFLVIVSSSSSSQQLILQTLVIAFATWRIVGLTVSARINKWAQDIDRFVSVRYRLHLLHIAWRGSVRNKLSWLQLVIQQQLLLVAKPIRQLL